MWEQPGPGGGNHLVLSEHSDRPVDSYTADGSWCCGRCGDQVTTQQLACPRPRHGRASRIGCPAPPGLLIDV
jgi:hypothetical protein